MRTKGTSLGATRRLTSAPTTLHDTLVAWQQGKLTTRQTMALTGIDTVADLYVAARSSAVPIRKTLLDREKRAADIATAAIRKRLSTSEAASVER